MAKLEKVEVKFKDLREAVIALNDSGLLPEKIKLVGAEKEAILKAFMDGMGKIEDVDGKFPGPKVALALYNDIVAQEDKIREEQKKEATKKEDTKPTKEEGTMAKDEKKDKKAAAKAEETTPKKAAAKDKAPKKEKADKGPGVIETILNIIEKDGPIAIEKIIEKLAKRFPDRDAEKMTKTVRVQVGGKKQPTRMERERKVKFVIDDKGRIALK